MTRRRATGEPPSEVRRCAIYTRKSTSAGLDSDFNSLDAQRESCLSYIGRQPGWQVLDEPYDDGGFTGANTDRPAFQQLMADVEAGKIDTIVVYKVDRLSRSLLDFVKVMERLAKAGASFVSVTQNFSTADAMGRLTMNMLMSFAEFEREMISERTRDKIAASRRRGKWTGGPTPFGYRVADKKLVIDEVEAQVVRAMFQLFLEHRQMAKVAQLLNDRGLLPRGIASRPAHGGLRWRKEGVARVLRNALYVGQMPYGKELHPGEHEPLIDRAVFHQAQLILEGKRGAPQRPGLNPDYVLRGLLRCGKCGVMMCPGSTKHGRRTHRYYRCATRDKFGVGTCSARALPAMAIEEFVVQRIAEESLRGELAADVHRTLTARIEKRRAEATELRAQLPERIATAADHAKRLTEQSLRLNGRARELVEAQLVVESDRLVAAERQLAEATADLEALDAAQAEAEWLVGTLRDFARVWQLLTPENQGRLLRVLVAEIRVDEDQALLEVELIDFARQGAREAA